MLAGLGGGVLLLLIAFIAIRYSLPTQREFQAHLSALEKARLAEAIHLRQQLGDLVWSGWGQVDIPVILYNQDYAFLVGYPQPPSGWLNIGNGERRGGSWELVSQDTFQGEPYYRQSLKELDTTPQAFTVLVGDQWVASMTTKEWTELGLIAQIHDDLPPVLNTLFAYIMAIWQYNTDWHICLLLHESFHAYHGNRLPEAFRQADAMQRSFEKRYPWEDEEFQQDWQIELNLLADALRTPSQSKMVELIRKFLEHRDARRQRHQLDDALVTYEQQREWVEGLAKYVELEIWKQAATSSSYTPITALEEDSDFKHYATFEQRWKQEVAQMKRMAGDRGDGRFYYTGFAQAALLDRLIPGWEESFFEQGIFLEELLQRHIYE
jgi:hypothetical protein